MFLIRRAKSEDGPTLLKLAKMVHFMNLPADKDIISEKILWSRQCFTLAASGEGPAGDAAPRRAVAIAAETATARVAQGNVAGGGVGGVNGRHGKGDTRWGGGVGGQSGQTGEHTPPRGLRAVTSHSRLFMFVLEDTESEGALGTSQIVAQMGGPGHPNVSLQLSRKEKFSSTLQFGTTHIVARLHMDESSPTEIGGLILQPSFRRHKERLGRLLSTVRFHYMALNRGMFADRVLAELMPPLTADGRSQFYENFGRRFINLSYEEADRFCQHSKEFLLSLMPHEEIYLTLLPPEARNEVGQVGAETVPARKMLEDLGFAYHNRIDPFDGGPHLEARTDSIGIVRDTRRAELVGTAAADACRTMALVSATDETGEFRAMRSVVSVGRGNGGGGGGRIRLPGAVAELLGVSKGDVLGVTLLGPRAANDAGPVTRKQKGRGSKAAGRAAGRRTT